MLRWSKNPIYYNSELYELSINYIPVCLVLHLMFAIYMYGSPNLFPTVYLSLFRLTIQWIKSPQQFLPLNSFLLIHCMMNSISKLEYKCKLFLYIHDIYKKYKIINLNKINRYPYLLFLLIITGSFLVAYDTIII